jgi:hypothetical protein
MLAGMAAAMSDDDEDLTQTRRSLFQFIFRSSRGIFAFVETVCERLLA